MVGTPTIGTIAGARTVRGGGSSSGLPRRGAAALAEQEALHEVEAELAREPELLGALDALEDRVRARLVRHLDERPHQGADARLAETPDDRAVELQHVGARERVEADERVRRAE